MGARQAWQRARRHESFEIIAQMLLDIASYERVVVLAPDGKPPEDEVRRLRHAVRGREAQCVQALLGHHRFRAQDVAGSDLPIEGGSWTLDLFSPEALRHFGIRFSSAAAAGAAVGLGLDLALHGLSLGAMTLSGAAIGGLLGAARVHGRRALDRARGFTHMSVDDPALCLLAVRQMRLLEAMERRGHAAVEPIEALAPGSDGRWAEKSVLPLLRRARQYPDWSSLGGAMPPLPTPARRRAVEEIVRELQKHGPLDAPQTP